MVKGNIWKFVISTILNLDHSKYGWTSNHLLIIRGSAGRSTTSKTYPYGYDGDGFQLQQNEEAFDNYVLRVQYIFYLQNITEDDDETVIRRIQIVILKLNAQVN